MSANRGANLSQAFGRVWERPWLVAALALVNLGLSLVLTAPLSAMLATLLDKRPAATAMVGGDDGLWIEFMSDHADVMAVASVALGAGVILYGIFSWILDGGVLAALALDGERRARGAAQVLAESAWRSKRMLVLGLFGLLLRGIPALFGAIAFGSAHAVITGRTFQPNLMTAMIALVIAAITWTAMSIALDYARGLSLDDPQTRSWRLVGRGLRLLFTRRLATLQLIAFTLAAWLAVGVLYWQLAAHVNALILLTFLRLVALVARVAITMTTLTAAARIARS